MESYLADDPELPDTGNPTFDAEVLGLRRAHADAVRQRILARCSAGEHREARAELVRAEIDRELSEVEALILHAVLCNAEGSEDAGEYLEMAEAAAASPAERAMVAEQRATHELLHRLEKLAGRGDAG